MSETSWRNNRQDLLPGQDVNIDFQINLDREEENDEMLHEHMSNEGDEDSQPDDDEQEPWIEFLFPVADEETLLQEVENEDVLEERFLYTGFSDDNDNDNHDSDDSSNNAESDDDSRQYHL